MSNAWRAIAAQCDIIVDEDTERVRTWNLKAEPRDVAEFLRITEGLAGLPRALLNAVHYSDHSPIGANLSDKCRTVQAPDGYVKSVQFYDDVTNEAYRAYLATL